MLGNNLQWTDHVHRRWFIFQSDGNIHALDDFSPEKITRVLNAEIYEVAESNDDHPRKIYIGVPKNQQGDSRDIKLIGLVLQPATGNNRRTTLIEF